MKVRTMTHNNWRFLALFLFSLGLIGPFPDLRAQDVEEGVLEGAVDASGGYTYLTLEPGGDRSSVFKLPVPGDNPLVVTIYDESLGKVQSLDLRVLDPAGQEVPVSIQYDGNGDQYF